MDTSRQAVSKAPLSSSLGMERALSGETRVLDVTRVMVVFMGDSQVDGCTVAGNKGIREFVELGVSDRRI